eukprot:8522913-Pyramimonas_sp.AAC.1
MAEEGGRAHRGRPHAGHAPAEQSAHGQPTHKTCAKSKGLSGATHPDRRLAFRGPIRRARRSGRPNRPPPCTRR